MINMHSNPWCSWPFPLVHNQWGYPYDKHLTNSDKQDNSLPCPPVPYSAMATIHDFNQNSTSVQLPGVPHKLPLIPRGWSVSQIEPPMIRIPPPCLGHNSSAKKVTRHQLGSFQFSLGAHSSRSLLRSHLLPPSEYLQLSPTMHSASPLAKHAASASCGIHHVYASFTGPCKKSIGPLCILLFGTRMLSNSVLVTTQAHLWTLDEAMAGKA